MTPALIQSLSDAIVPHMIEAGRKIGKDTEHEDVESTLEKIVSFFDMKEGKVIKERRKISVVVKYKAYNSVDGFVGMSSALVEGFLETRGNRVSKERRLSSGNEYVLRFDLLR
jgi:predicted hydrocarbon binding protein